MAGIPHGRVDGRVNLQSGSTTNPAAACVQEVFKTLFDFFSTSGRHTRIAWYRGDSGGTIPGGTSRGSDYWDGAAPLGPNAFFVVDWVNASARYQMYVHLFDGSTAGTNILQEGFAQGWNGNIPSIGVSMASGVGAGGAWVSPWAGTTANNGLDTRPANLWTIPTGGRGYFFPRCNSRGGSNATNRNNLAAVFRSSSVPTSSFTGRFHLATDDDNWALLEDPGDDGGYYLSTGGVYVPRADLVVDRPLVMLTQLQEVDGLQRYVDNTSIVFGPPTVTSQQTANGGIRVSDNLVGAGGAGVGIDVHGVIVDGLPVFDSNLGTIVGNFNPDKAFPTVTYNELPHFLGTAENAAAYCFAGQYTFMGTIGGVLSLDSNTGRDRAYFGTTTALRRRVAIPWNGTTAPGAGSSRAGLSF